VWGNCCTSRLAYRCYFRKFTEPIDSCYFRKFPSIIPRSLLIRRQFPGWVHNLYPSSLSVRFWLIQTAMDTGTLHDASSPCTWNGAPALVPPSTFLAPKDVNFHQSKKQLLRPDGLLSKKEQRMRGNCPSSGRLPSCVQHWLLIFFTPRKLAESWGKWFLLCRFSWWSCLTSYHLSRRSRLVVYRSIDRLHFRYKPLKSYVGRWISQDVLDCSILFCGYATV